MNTPRLVPVADHALLVQLAEEIGEAASARVLALDRALAEAPPEGLCEVVPAFVNILIEFDPRVTNHTAMATAVSALIDRPQPAARAGRVHEVAVCYDADLAPDLDVVAKATGLSPEAVIAAHLAGDYRIAMYGFAPGYAYMSGVPQEIRVPRKPAPLRGIPAGSVLIAGPQCLVTTLTMPTGWSIIGRSPTRILMDDPVHPFRFDVGDRVAFRRVDRATHQRLADGAPA